jgi:hypothetical protein
MFENADLILRYTRADALRDGVLIDATAVAREAGIRYPVALTRAAWERGVAVPTGGLSPGRPRSFPPRARPPTDLA